MRDNTESKSLNKAIKLAVLLNFIVFVSCSTLLVLSINEVIYYNGKPVVLKVARTSNPIIMDPCDSFDSVSNGMLDQVVETLIAYDLTDSTLPLVGRLAYDWDLNIGVYGKYNNITFYLRENVYFHDGELFTGEDVIHTFERINFFGNSTGSLDPALHIMASPHALYKFSDGMPIFNVNLSRDLWDTTKVTDEYKVTLIMNGPFAPAEGLLAYTASAIVGHTSTPKYEMLDLRSDLVIGTGPFKLIRYIPNSEVRFVRWERYWRTGAYWTEIQYIYYEDATAANNAMLTGNIDWLGQGLHSFIPSFESDPDIMVTGDGVNDYINSSTYWFIEFNSMNFNRTWRKAISHGFNYTYVLHNIKEDTVSKAHSLVPSGFPAYNSSVVGGRYNIPYARQLMQKMGFGEGWDVGSQIGDTFFPGTDEAQWTTAAFIPSTGNYTDNEINFYHRQGSYFSERLIQRFSEDMDLIGIKIVPQVITWGITTLYTLIKSHPERIHIFWREWSPDYFGPFAIIDPLVNPNSESNYALIDNPEINAILAQSKSESITTQRYNYFKKLQYLIHDKYYYHLPLFYDKLYHVQSSFLKGVPYNSMSNLNWYPTYEET